jgi:hypothetical protein
MEYENEEYRKQRNYHLDGDFLKNEGDTDGIGLLIDDETSIYEVDLECMKQKDKG